MKLVVGPLAALLAAALVAGCATPSRFEWGTYEGSLYTYAKKPDQRAGYETALQNAIARGRATNRLAPGLLAELGYLALEDGDTAEAIQYFEEEMQAFPESRAFLSSIVSRTKGVEPATPVASKSEVTS